MSRREWHYCGECALFGYEDVYGMGYCLLNKDNGFSDLKYCGEPSCSRFVLDEDEEDR